MYAIHHWMVRTFIIISIVVLSAFPGKANPQYLDPYSKYCTNEPLIIESQYFVARVHIPVSASCPGKSTDKGITASYYDPLMNHVFEWMLDNGFEFSRIGIAGNKILWDFYFKETANFKNLRSFVINIRNVHYYQYPGFFRSTIILHGPEHHVLTYQELFGEQREEAQIKIIDFVSKKLVKRFPYNALTQKPFPPNFSFWQTDQGSSLIGLTINFEMYDIGNRPDGEIDVNVPVSVFREFIAQKYLKFF